MKRLGQSFSQSEVEAMCSVLLMLPRKGDPRVLMETPEMMSVSKKFLMMKKRMKAGEGEEE